MRIRGAVLTRQRGPTPGSWTISLIGMVLGAIAVAGLEALIWAANTASPTAQDAVARATATLSSPDARQLGLLAAGGFIGFLVAGIARGSIRSRGMADVVLSVFGLGLGFVLGGLLTLVAYVAVRAYTIPGLTFNEAMFAMAQTFASGEIPYMVLTLTGGYVGMVLAGYMMGTRFVERVGTFVTGTLLGGLAGMMIYAVGSVAAQFRPGMNSNELLYLLGEAVNAQSPLEFTFLFLGSLIGVLIGRYSWQFYGLVTLTSLVSVVVGFLAYSFFITLPQVEPQFKPLAVALFIFETISLGMVVLYSFYTIDVATRKRWRKKPEDNVFSDLYIPKVALQVPTFNEPPELVKETLAHLLRLDYPKDRHVIMCLDDSTDPASAVPLQAYCKENDIMYIHRAQRGGYKAGALNNALKFTPPDAELLAVVDADYQVQPDYLKKCVGFFINSNLAWVQTPQDYRNRHQSFLTEQYYLADSYFYKTVMPSRNEENTIIFCGTMGILRKDALLAVGGWGEKYISEDAELSVRLLNEGWESLYINHTFGKGLIPATFEGYKKQHYRWAFGGAKILRGHFWKIFFGRLSRRQTFDYFVGSAHWFEGLAILAISLVVSLLALGEILGFDVVTHHDKEILLIGLVPFFILADGLTRLHMVMRQSLQLSFSRTIKVLGMWFSVKFSNAFGALKSFVGFTMPFVRTPKAPHERVTRPQAFWRAIRVAKFESFMALFELILTVSLAAKLWVLRNSFDTLGGWVRSFLVVWLLYYTLVYMSAPLYAYKSYVTFVPDEQLQTTRQARPTATA